MITAKILKNSLWVLFVLAFSLLGCRKHTVYNKIVDVNNNGWYKDSIVQIKFTPKNIKKPYNISFLIRNDNTYPYANIFLIATMENDQKKIKDTLEYAMANKEGKWLGSGIWDLKESKLIYKKNYRFKDTLPVIISMQQAVRKSGNTTGDLILPGIKTVGIIIEEAE